MADHDEKEHGGGEGQGGHSGGGHGAPGGGHEDHHEGAPEWLISFADNVALMMGFFVILLAMNMKSPKTYEGIGGPDEHGGNVDQLDFVLALRSSEEIVNREMMLQGILSIQAGDNPRVTQDKMLAFVPQTIRVKLKQAA